MRNDESTKKIMRELNEILKSRKYKMLWNKTKDIIL
jgi:hypothetical protein